MLLLALASLLLPFPQDRFGPIEELAGSIFAPEQILARDFDGDGTVDLIVASGEYDYVSSPFFAHGNGDGTFELFSPILTSLRAVLAMDAADLDGDGILDLAAVDRDSGLAIWRGTGSGDFVLDRISGPFFAHRKLKIVDLDQDGVPDVVGYRDNQFADFPLWVKRDANGDLSPPQSVLDGPARSSWSQLFDLDQDGDLDFVASEFKPSSSAAPISLAWIENEGSLPLQRANAQTIVSLGTDVLQFAIADLDEDGDPDVLATLVSPSPTVDLAMRPVLNAGSAGAFTLGTILGGLDLGYDLQTHDINGDGILDVVSQRFSAQGDNGPFYHLGLGIARYAPPQLLGEISRGSKVVVLDDVNADQMPDAIVGSQPTSASLITSSPFSVRVHLNQGSPSGGGGALFSPPQDVSENIGEGPVLVGDLDGDGDEDLVGHRAVGDSYISSLENLGDGQFARSVKLADTAPPAEESKEGATLGDIDSDGDLDIAFVAPGAGWIEAIFNDGNGQFSDPVTLVSWPGTASYVELLDVDDDGALDLVGTSEDERRLFVSLQGAGGLFGAPMSIAPLFGGAVRFEALFVDDDGVTDLVTLSSGELKWLRGLGGGQFSQPATLVVLPWDASEFAYGEFTGDGRRDLAVIEDFSSFPPVTFETLVIPAITGAPMGMPAFGNPISALVASTTMNKVVAADINGDSVDDLVGIFRDSDALGFAEGAGDGTFRDMVALDLEGPLNRIVRSFNLIDRDNDGDLEILFGSLPKGAISTIRNESVGVQGEVYCGFFFPNSTGMVGVMSAHGAAELVWDELRLEASQLPLSATAIFLTSRELGFDFNVPGSVGTLCLGGQIGRFVGPGQIQNTGSTGAVQLDLDLMALPQPNQSVMAAAGETWHFQLWHRDTGPDGTPTSNFTVPLRVLFR